MGKKILVIPTLAIVGLVCAPRAAHAQYFKVGSFTKSTTTTGCPASCTNTVAHGLPAGVTPTALILWTTSDSTGNSIGPSFRWAFGVTDGTRSRSASAAALKLVNPSQTNRRAAAVPLTISDTTGTTPLAEATFQSPAWDGTNFYLQWSPNNASSYIIHFIAIGGSGVQAQVVEWLAATTGSSTTVTLSPAFTPGVVLNFMDSDTAALPSSVADAAFMLGVMDAGNHQWASAFYSKNGVNPTQCARAQRTDSAIELTGPTGTETLRGHLHNGAMNSNGFTVDSDVNTTGSAYRIFSLALTGVNLWAGTFNRNAPSCGGACGTPESQSVTMTDGTNTANFTPSVVLFASFSANALGTTNQPPLTDGANFLFGATDATTRGNDGILDVTKSMSGGNKSTNDHWDYTSTVLNGDLVVAIKSLAEGRVAEATLGSLNVSAFTLSWTVVFSTNTEEINYLALGSLGPTSVTLASFTAVRMLDGKTRLEWRTGYEVDNVGFRLYREQNGKRVRITSSLVPGTALVGIGRGMSSGGRTYTWSDTTVPPDAGLVQYWLEDVDLKGRSTWHGPIVPVSVPSREPR